MQSGISRLIKVLAIVIWALGLIAGIGAGYLGSSADFGFDYASGFDFWTMLVVWVIFYVAGVLYFAFGILLGHVIDHREDTSYQLTRITEALERVLFAAEGKPAPLEDPAAMRAIYHDPFSVSIRANAPRVDTPEPVSKAPEGTVFHKKDMKRVSPSTVICPYCRHEQSVNRSACLWCGSKYID